MACQAPLRVVLCALLTVAGPKGAARRHHSSGMSTGPREGLGQGSWRLEWRRGPLLGSEIDQGSKDQQVHTQDTHMDTHPSAHSPQRMLTHICLPTYLHTLHITAEATEPLHGHGCHGGRMHRKPQMSTWVSVVSGFFKPHSEPASTTVAHPQPAFCQPTTQPALAKC